MQNYDVTRPLVRENFGHSPSTFQAEGAVRTIFTCSSGVGDFKLPNTHVFGKNVYHHLRGYNATDTCLSGRYKFVGSIGVVDTASSSHLVNPFDFQPEVSDRAMEKVYDAIRGGSNFAVDLAESAAVLRMLKSTLNLKRLVSQFIAEVIVPLDRDTWVSERIEKSRRRRRGISWLPRKKKPRKRLIKRVKLSKGQSRLDYITQKWLEWQYGWYPLLLSIYDALDTLGGQHIVDGAFPVKGRSKRVHVATSQSGSGSYNSPRVTKVTMTSFRMEYCFRFNLKSEARVSDWTSLDPANILWQLAPLSFVADWVWNVSQHLSLWENYYLFRTQVAPGGYCTTTYLQTTSEHHVGYTKGSYMRWANGTFMDGPYGDKRIDATRQLVTTYKNRVKADSLPTPGSVRLLVNFGAKRQLDAAALLHQLVVKRFR